MRADAVAFKPEEFHLDVDDFHVRRDVGHADAGTEEMRLLVYFFFQAEDGIRDFHVTGVQTCALPISLWLASANGKSSRCSAASTARRWGSGASGSTASHKEIGRASCRERV